MLLIIVSVGYLLFTPLLLMTVGIACWRKRSQRPITARLLVGAVCCRAVPFMLLVLGGFGFSTGDLEIESEFNWPMLLEPGAVRFLIRQLMIAGFEIASWSLIVWAILMRPDAAQRELQKPESTPP